jgi:hypothetical protein
VARPVDQRARRADLHDAAEVDDRDAVGEMIHHGDVMRDEQHREVEAPLQRVEQIDDLCLDRHVERRDRLVGDQQRGTDRQGARDADALALPAGKLMRPPVGVFGPERHHVEQLEHAFAPLTRAARHALHVERLGDYIGDAHQRVERAVGVLENHLRVAPEQPQRVAVEQRDVAPREADLARGRLDQPQHAAPDRRLAGAGFASDPEHLARPHRE